MNENSDNKSQVQPIKKNFGIQISAFFILFFIFMLLIINIPPIPLPFTSSKLYLINQEFAETFRFYSYSVFYFVLIFLVFSFIYNFMEKIFKGYQTMMDKFRNFLDGLV